MKLSAIQTEVLKKMRDGKTHTGYGLGVSMGTMYALLSRGLIRRTNYGELIWMGWENTEYDFMITPKGILEVGGSLE